VHVCEKEEDLVHGLVLLLQALKINQKIQRKCGRIGSDSHCPFTI
jgi:hypothetical protein